MFFLIRFAFRVYPLIKSRSGVIKIFLKSRDVSALQFEYDFWRPQNQSHIGDLVFRDP